MSAQTKHTSENRRPIPTIITVDPLKPATEQQNLHNRWHPDIPAVVTVETDKAFKVECTDWSGGQQFTNGNLTSALQNVNLKTIHYLSGPIAIEGAQPGDLLVVDILDVQCFDNVHWGYTASLGDGTGALASEGYDFSGSTIWNLQGVSAASETIPGVSFNALPHPCVIGTAPSGDLLEEWTNREKNLRGSAHGGSNSFLPDEEGAYIGQKLPQDVMEEIKRCGARTLPGRENGGNADIKNLSKGSRCYFPVFVPGANLSVGDLNFSAGDGKISFCGGIAMPGIITLKAKLIKNGIKNCFGKGGLTLPMSVPSLVDPLYSQKLCFEGLSFNANGDGEQYSLDTTVAFKQAALNAINYLVTLDYTKEQAYLLLSAAPIESHVAAVVDPPNACVTIGIPTEIFDKDILPQHNVPHKLGERAT